METPSDRITSTHNPTIVSIRSLHRRKARREQGAFLVEGVRLVRDVFASGAECRFLVYCPEMLGDTPFDPDALVQRTSQKTRILAVTPAVMQSLTDTESPQGVIAVVTREETALPPLDPDSGLVLVLDGVRDPGNVGTLLRTATAAGCTVVVTTTGTADAFAPKVVRAGMGAHFILPIVTDTDWRTFGPELAPLPTVYGAVAGAGTSYDMVDWTRGAAIIIGNEDHGVSDEALRWCRGAVSIPMAAGVESLNAAVSGAILIFEAVRQRRNARRS